MTIYKIQAVQLKARFTKNDWETNSIIYLELNVGIEIVVLFSWDTT